MPSSRTSAEASTTSGRRRRSIPASLTRSPSWPSSSDTSPTEWLRHKLTSANATAPCSAVRWTCQRSTAPDSAARDPPGRRARTEPPTRRRADRTSAPAETTISCLCALHGSQMDADNVRLFAPIGVQVGLVRDLVLIKGKDIAYVGEVFDEGHPQVVRSLGAPLISDY